MLSGLILLIWQINVSPRTNNHAVLNKNNSLICVKNFAGTDLAANAQIVNAFEFNESLKVNLKPNEALRFHYDTEWEWSSSYQEFILRGKGGGIIKFTFEEKDGDKWVYFNPNLKLNNTEQKLIIYTNNLTLSPVSTGDNKKAQYLEYGELTVINSSVDSTEIIISNILVENASIKFGVGVPVYVDSYFEKLPEGFYHFVPNSEFLQDGYFVKLKPYLVRTNNEGFRDNNHLVPKRENLTRIGIFGDSFTFGWGMQEDEMFSNILSDYLNNQSRDFEVFNFGFPGHGIYEHYQTYQKFARKYNLNLIFILYSEDDINSWDDLQDLISEYLKSIDAGPTAGKEKEASIWAFKKLDEKIAQDYEGMLEKKEENFRYFVKNTSVVIFKLPFFHPDNEKIFSEFCKRYNISLVPLNSYYNRYDYKDLILNKDDVHPNQLAHQLIAEAMFNYSITKIHGISE